MKYTFEKLNGFTPYIPVLPQDGIIANANESFLPVNADLSLQIADQAARIAANRYPEPTAEKVRKGFGAFYGVDPELVTVGNGSDELLSVLICGFLTKGDHLVTLTPDFSMYPFYAKLSGAEHVALEKNADLTFDVDETIRRVNEIKPKLLIFSNPCNPSSVGMPRDTVRRIVRECDCVVIVDEAYMDFWDESLLPEAAQYDNLIVLRTLSKVGYAAYRLGFAVANAELTALIRAVKSPYNINSLSQAAGEAVFSRPDDLRARILAIRRSRDELYAEVCELQAQYPNAFTVPESRANFVTLLMPDPKPLFEYLTANRIYVSLNAGKYLRITCCAPEDNQKITAALRAYFESKE
ncbi:MAG: histidinol-phosphate aminotransferase family protein [Clostridia bacterium]|nr:histidinol-phosphate aminotransferase family protein [Clostridia bacterium]